VPYFEDFEIRASHFCVGGALRQRCAGGCEGLFVVVVVVILVVVVLCCAALYCNFFWTRVGGSRARCANGKL